VLCSKRQRKQTKKDFFPNYFLFRCLLLFYIGKPLIDTLIKAKEKGRHHHYNAWCIASKQKRKKERRYVGTTQRAAEKGAAGLPVHFSETQIKPLRGNV
jgi:hypothetical protein